MQKDYRLVTTMPEFEKMMAEFEAKEDSSLLAFDLETTSLREKTAVVTDIAMSHSVGMGANVCLRYYDIEKEKLLSFFSAEEEIQIAKRINQLLAKRAITGWNLVYDVAVWFWRYNFNFAEFIAGDGMLMKHTVDEMRPHGLKQTAVKYQREIGIPEEEIANQEQEDLKKSILANGGSWNKSSKEFFKADYKIRGTYACSDVDLSLRLFHYFDERLFQEGLEEFFYDIEVMPLYKKATIPMKLGGIHLDVKYFENLKKEVEGDIIKLEANVFETIEPWIQPLVKQILNEKVPVKRRGQFAEKLLLHTSLDVPLTPSGKPSLAKSKLQRLEASYPGHAVLKWLLWEPTPITDIVQTEVLDDSGNITGYELEEQIIDYDYSGEPELESKLIDEIQREIFLTRNPDCPKVFNLASNDHLAWLLFEHLGLEPMERSRKTNKPKVDKESLENYKDEHPFVDLLLQLFKLEKLYGTYICPILINQVDGVMYPSFMQHGTTSGRYSSGGGGINFQTLPRDDKRIKKGFIAPPGYKFVNADFSSLEPRVFAWVSDEPGLKAVYNAGLDLYSQIAIDVFGLDPEVYSADPNHPNFIKKTAPEWRNKCKVFTLAVVYGANAWRIGKLMNIDFEEATTIINKYLDSYPKLRDYMDETKWAAINKGKVLTRFGRVRHLEEANYLYYKAGANRTGYGKLLFKKRAMKDLLGDELGDQTYYRFRNMINNSRNFPIQSTAAHIANAAMIKLANEMEENNIDGWICLQIHDEITTIVREDQAALQTKLLQDSMENNWVTEEIDIPIIAEPEAGYNLAEVK